MDENIKEKLVASSQKSKWLVKKQNRLYSCIKTLAFHPKSLQKATNRYTIITSNDKTMLKNSIEGNSRWMSTKNSRSLCLLENLLTQYKIPITV